jgi:hypothetical protein
MVPAAPLTRTNQRTTFLAGPDLGDRPLPLRIEVDAPGLLMRPG